MTVDDTHIALARHLAETARQTLNAPPQPGFEIKQDGSPVTALDRAVEAALRAEIAKAAPDHGIIGEEYGAENSDRNWVWILDPIDGTRQFAAGLPNFGTLIALSYQNRPLVGVISHPWTGMTCLGVVGQGTWINDRPVRTLAHQSPADVIACLSDPDAFDAATTPGYKAIRAASRWNVYDGGCLGYAALASGHIGIALNGPNLEPFDIAALIPVIDGAGGVISDWHGGASDARSEGAIVGSANPALHDAVLDVLANAR